MCIYTIYLMYSSIGLFSVYKHSEVNTHLIATRIVFWTSNQGYIPQVLLLVSMQILS